MLVLLDEERPITLNETPTTLFTKELKFENQLRQGIGIRVYNQTLFSLTLDLKFISMEGKEIIISFNILPSTDVTVPISFSYLNSQTLFPERTKGRLRMMVNGTPMKKEEVKKMILSSRACHTKRNVILKEVNLLDQIHEGKIHHPKILIDSFGQWKDKEWKGKTHDEDQLKEELQKQIKKTDNPEKKAHAENKWFRVKKKNEKWYFIDPDERPFISIGMDCIRPSIECRVGPVECFIPEKDRKKGERIDYCQRNLETAFGKEWRSKWDDLIISYLKEWGINTIGNWSDIDFIKKSKLPYVLPLDVYSETGYPSTAVKIFRDFPDVFSPEFEENSNRYAKALLPFKDDPMMVGYFMRNEPEWAFEYDVVLAEQLMEMEEESYTKEAFICYLETKYSTVKQLTEAWGLANLSDFRSLFHTNISKKEYTKKAQQDFIDFSEKMVRRYVSLPAKACKSIDEHHLNLGMRYAYIANEQILAGSEYFDVFSINCYQEDPTDKIEQVAKLTGLPVMIGEFHFGALDRGLSSTGIKGCLTQEDRASAYNYYFEKAALHPNFIGAHYFALYDQSCLGRHDGENYQFGFLDICSMQYEDFTKKITVTNDYLLAVHNEEKQLKAMHPHLIPPIYC